MTKERPKTIAKLKEVERHILLYSKHWYKRSDVISDLKTIIGKCVDVDPIHISIQVVFDFIVELCERELKYDKRLWLWDLFKDKGRIAQEDVIKKHLGVLSTTCRHDYPELLAAIGYPDEEILQLTKIKPEHDFRRQPTSCKKALKI